MAAVVFKISARVTAYFVARAARKRYFKLPTEDRAAFANKVWRWMMMSVGVLGVGTGGLFAYHMNTVPVTGRRRLLVTSIDTEMEHGREEAKKMKTNYANLVVPQNHPFYTRVWGVCRRLIAALEDKRNPLRGRLDPELLAKLRFNLTVVHDPTANAFVLPDGSIFVFTGLLNECDSPTDDKLAMVIGHEIAHALLRHGFEGMTDQYILMLGLSVVTTFIMFAIFPDFGWFWVPVTVPLQLKVEQWKEGALSLLFELPFCRERESEADYVGTLLASTACYDPRYAPLIWSEWFDLEGYDKDAQEKMNELDSLVEFTRSHPCHEHRADDLEKWVPEALELRGEGPSGCAPLRAALEGRHRHGGGACGCEHTGGEKKTMDDGAGRAVLPHSEHYIGQKVQVSPPTEYFAFIFGSSIERRLQPGVQVKVIQETGAGEGGGTAEVEEGKEGTHSTRTGVIHAGRRGLYDVKFSDSDATEVVPLRSIRVSDVGTIFRTGCMNDRCYDVLYYDGSSECRVHKKRLQLVRKKKALAE
eukprot:CAMPEP_0185756292 /NCGR_PEP_ID=MMETSP1174-20130828/14712_1 /TAXON_ID=35687 /ORGANISM="Dictyocha speculum, Strain CCMP1381" /LENGTH=529 /DNA_ID=CAMNT_0028435179 /DNA_START=254 /DNA_END=1846 /DNA_ORIENTATION=+